MPHHACHDALANKWQLLFALCLHPLRFVHLLALSLFPRSSLLFSALLSLSYWHRWKAVQYFYHSLLTRLSHATVNSRSPSARHQTAFSSLTLAFARYSTRPEGRHNAFHRPRLQHQWPQQQGQQCLCGNWCFSICSLAAADGCRRRYAGQCWCSEHAQDLH